jgi:hypothetical protein
VVLVVVSPFLLFSAPVYSQPSWPILWIQIDLDKNENSIKDDWRDVEYACYQYDSDYLYLKLKCYDIIGKEWPDSKGRYKWFIDFEGDMYHSGGSIYDAEYLVFVEDTDNDGFGEMYLVFDTNGDNNFGEYEPWPPANNASYRVTDPNVGGWRIFAQYQIEMYINWASIGNPPSYWITWATDQENPNLDQGPTTDHVDEEQPIAVHDVAAISQTPTPTSVTQGDPVTVEVVVENQGTQTSTFDVTCYFDTGVVGTLTVTNLAAGYDTTLNFNWDTTGVPTGTYTIQAWADSSAAIAETDETDNWCTAPATVTVQPALVHDVAATSQVPNVTEVQQGDAVEIEVTVENLGNFIETFTVTCYYDSSQIGTQTVTNLQPSSSTTLTFVWYTTGMASGTYYISAVASPVPGEKDTNDNSCTSITMVTVTAPSPPPPPVGGFALPITLDLGTSRSSISQIGLVSALSVAVAAAIILVRFRKKTLKGEG